MSFFSADMGSEQGLEDFFPWGRSRATRVALLGASGSIGTAVLDVIAASRGRLTAEMLCVWRNTKFLAEAARKFRPKTVVVTDPEADKTPLAEISAETEILFGPESLDHAIRRGEIDLVVSAIVGAAGLASTVAALESGKDVALANKESLVMAGPILIELARRQNAAILPIDSEHSAILQSLASRNPRRNPGPVNPRGIEAMVGGESVRRLILTASGGPFRTKTGAELEHVTVAEALAHPTWRMGRKITIDSATMMNKALEMIEARWLFDIPADRIDVVIHPESTIHSMVEFVDGSVVAQLGRPDMRLPIQWALYGMEHVEGPAERLDWTEPFSLHFSPPDESRFPAISLGRRAAADGGSAGAVLNAANETAVEAFLTGQIPLVRIAQACRAILDEHHFQSRPSLDQLFALDRWARTETLRWISD